MNTKSIRPVGVMAGATTATHERRPAAATASRIGHAPRAVSAPERIRARAYEIYLAHVGNGLGGDELSDWLQAERELSGAAPATLPRAMVETRAMSRGEAVLVGDD